MRLRAAVEALVFPVLLAGAGNSPAAMGRRLGVLLVILFPLGSGQAFQQSLNHGLGRSRLAGLHGISFRKGQNQLRCNDVLHLLLK